MTAIILTDISYLHQAFYNHVAAITGIDGLVYLGFDDGKSRSEIPEVAMHMSCAAYAVDRGRITPRVQSYTSAEISIVYDDESYDVQTDYLIQFPLPIDIFYEISAWCHDSQTALQMDLALMRTIPERGTLNFVIEGSEADFPVELIGIQDLDDLSQNIREKVYRYKLEAWIPGYLDDQTGKIITSIENNLYKYQTQDGEISDQTHLDAVLLEPDA